MKVEQFVKDMLLAITDGVASAQDDSKLFIAPGKIDQEYVDAPQMVSFEINVVVEVSGKGGANILNVLEIGSDANKQWAHKVSFEVPVYFQLQTENHPRAKIHFVSPDNKGEPK